MTALFPDIDVPSGSRHDGGHGQADFIIASLNKARIMEFFSLAVPRSESELSLMESMLIAYDIPFYVHNRGFGGLYPGMQIPLYNVQRVMVPVAYAEVAIELFSAFQENYDETFTCEKLEIRDRLRGIVEIVLGGWTVPFRFRKFLSTKTESDDS